jgi:pimeloyl-ACP methyl ester carboxylesterase
MKTILLAMLVLLAARVHAATNEAVSAVFEFDVRDTTGTTESLSGMFGLEARELGNSHSEGSWSFVLDSRGISPEWLTVAGQVRDAKGQPIQGSAIELRRYADVFWSGASAADGSFSIPAQVAAGYKLIVTKDGFLPLVENLAGSGGRQMNLVLQANLVAPIPTDVNRLANQLEKGNSPMIGDDLKVFDGSGWSSALPDKNRPTVVMTHGWNSDPNGWATGLAAMIQRYHGLAAPPNLVVWDWSARAKFPLVPLAMVDQACVDGEELGRALVAKLGANYSQKIHFIGHSMGTIVNRYACDYVHGRLRGSTSGWSASVTRPQVTLLDEAEIASVFGAEVITSSAIAMAVANWQAGLLVAAVKSAQNWKNPIPLDAAWIDNYISAVGWKRSEAVNVCLLNPSLTLGPTPLQVPSQLVAAHGYAHAWYRYTVGSSSANNGFQWASESGSAFPPLGVGMSPGSVWWENLDSTDALDVSQIRPDIGLVGEFFTKSVLWDECSFPAVRALAIEGSREALWVGATPAMAGKGVVNGLTWVGERVLDGYVKTGEVIFETSNKVGLFLDASIDNATDWLGSLNPDAFVGGALSASVLKMRLTSPAEVHSSPSGDGPLANGPAAQQEPGVWFTVDVPAQTAFVAFDFAVKGDSANDRIDFAVGGQNVFSLPARFVEGEQVSSTDMIDISRYAGQAVEFFFGLTGGTSHGCELTIEGIRFIAQPPPKLVIEPSERGVRLAWPAMATGWRIESSSSLHPDDWQSLPEDAATLEEGSAVMERTTDGPKKFYRLKRVSEE